jgi:flagella basal body P-ring formation protein FlgA
MLRTPLMVHRGEIVTVYARSGGVSVRTTARVREDGGMGDLVSVESLTERKGFIARVCGIRELEVFARAAQAESAAKAPVPVQ